MSKDGFIAEGLYRKTYVSQHRFHTQESDVLNHADNELHMYEGLYMCSVQERFASVHYSEIARFAFGISRQSGTACKKR